MDFQLSKEPIETLPEHGNVSIAYEYDRILDLTIVDHGLGGLVLTERQLKVAQVKDYDKLDDGGPASWIDRFNVSKWGFIVARSDGQRIGGAVIAWDTAGVEMLERRSDLAVLWDIRIDSAFRSHGVGTALFRAVEQWSAKRRCRQLKVETQNTNLAACKFYARQGCTLGAINRFAYPSLPNEIQLNWYKDLT